MNTQSTTFIEDFFIYVGRIHEFSVRDWVIYVLWVSTIFGLFAATFAFTLLGHSQGVQWPGYVWNVPIGAFIFTVAIAVDTIGHRTVYKEELLKGEALIHHITIFSGVTSVLALCLAYEHPEFMRIPAFVLMVLSIVYSLFDEAMHWIRYLTKKSDRVEMWSHYFIMVGHLTMTLSWWYWFDHGYPGVSETLRLLN